MDRVIGGVCGGLGEYLQIDPTFVRAFFVISAVFTAGVFVLVYAVLLILMPLPGERAPLDRIMAGATAQERPAEEGQPGQTPAPSLGRDRTREWFAYLLIGVGVIFLIGNLGAFRLVDWDVVWPLIVIAVGVFLIVGRAR